jgi:hypothetical protein
MMKNVKVGDTFRVFEVAYPCGLAIPFKGKTVVANKDNTVKISGMHLDYLELKQVGTIRIKSLKNNC